MLFEREAPLQRLHDLLAQARGGHGLCVQVMGEAGAGKTALLRAFTGALPAGVQALWAACEPLLTPRPLSPFVDLAAHWPPSLARALREGQHPPGLLADLHLALTGAPRVLVIDDLHWADDATREALRYLARRLQGLPLLLVLSYRDDDQHACGPLRALFGDLPAASQVHLPVAPLSAQAVAALAQAAGRDPAGLHETTGGNAFFVTEWLAAAGAPCRSVHDAVHARLQRLSPAARATAEQLAVSPTPLPAALLETLVPEPASIDEGCEKGMLKLHGGGVGFRHELARVAVLEGVPPLRMQRLHRRLHDVLAAQPGVPPERLVHHAAQAGLGAQVLALAPAAARAAAAASSHRESAALYRLALAHAHTADTDTRAGLLEAAAAECRIVGAADEALHLAEQALALRRAQGDAVASARLLRTLAHDDDQHGRRERALARLADAQAALQGECGDAANAEAVHVGSEHARLLSCLSRHAEAVAAGDAALALAESLPPSRAHRATLVNALRCASAVRLCVRDDEPAFAALERALALALTLDDDEPVAQIYGMLQLTSLLHRRHARALDYAAQGLAWCGGRDLDTQRARLLENRAFSLFEMARWREARRALDECLAQPGCHGRLRHSALFLEQRLRARTGDGDKAYWQALTTHPDATPLGYRLPAVLAACTEAAWLQGDTSTARPLARQGAAAAIAAEDGRLLGPLLAWLARLGEPLPAHALPIAPEHALELAGHHAAAAAAWHAHGCPYEAALAGLHGDTATAREALQTLLDLGAWPAAERARARLRLLGEASLPAGPLRATRDDPAGLTPRERQVHALLAQGLSNAGIAARLHRSPRTVEKHVAQVLAKLGMASRRSLQPPGDASMSG